MAVEETDPHYFRQKLKSYELGLVVSDDGDGLYDELLKILLEGKGGTRDTTKVNVAAFIELESFRFHRIVADVELTFATFKNVLLLKEISPILQGQCLVSMTSILIQAFGKFEEAELLGITSEHVEYLLSLVYQTNNMNNIYVRSVAANCLTEMELNFPCILQDAVDNIYTASVTETSVAHQLYVTLMSLTVNHAFADKYSATSLWGKRPKVSLKRVHTSEEVGSSELMLPELNQMLSFLVDQLHLYTPEGVVWVISQIVVMMASHANLRSSAQLLKLFTLQQLHSFSAHTFQSVLLIEEHLGDVVLEVKDHKQYVNQLLSNAGHPGLHASTRLLFLDWLAEYLDQHPDRAVYLNKLHLLLPSYFDEPECQVKKMCVLSSVLKHREGAVDLLLQLLSNVKTVGKQISPTKTNSVVAKIIYRLFCDHLYSDIDNKLPLYILELTVSDVQFSPFVLDLISRLKDRDVATSLLTTLVSTFASPNTPAQLYTLDVFTAAVPYGLPVCQPAVVLSYLQTVIGSEVYDPVSWVLGHHILSLCYNFMKEFNCTEFYYELSSMLKEFALHCRDVDLRDRANMYRTLLLCLSDRKLKEVLNAPKESLKNMMASEDTFHSQTDLRTLKKPPLQLCKVEPITALKSTAVLHKRDLLQLPEDILQIYREHIISIQDKSPVLVKCELKLTEHADLNLLPIQGLVLHFGVPASWGNIEHVSVGHFNGTTGHYDCNVPNLKCFPLKPCPVRVHVRAEFASKSMSYVSHLEPLHLWLSDLFHPLPVCDKFVSSPHEWRQAVFCKMWQELEHKVNNMSHLGGAFMSVLTILMPRNVMKPGLIDCFGTYLVCVDEDTDIMQVGIYLPPKTHLLMDVRLEEQKTMIHIATDDVQTLVFITDYLNYWLKKHNIL